MATDWVCYYLFLSLAKRLDAVRDYCDLNPPQVFSGCLGRGMVHWSKPGVVWINLTLTDPNT
jgi:hypothetical protein